MTDSFAIVLVLFWIVSALVAGVLIRSLSKLFGEKIDAKTAAAFFLLLILATQIAEIEVKLYKLEHANQPTTSVTAEKAK